MIKDIMKFYKGRRVLITGHTGFKGSWMTAVLLMAGAEVTGYALRPDTKPSLFELLGFDKSEQPDIERAGTDGNTGSSGYTGKLTNVYGDVRDLALLKETFGKAQPEIVIHMAAQPIVRTSYADPVTTYETNVMGTVNVLECCRLTETVKSIVNVTTDKVYRNLEREAGYREDEELCGYDPYSNSKSCSELVSDCYRNSFMNDLGIALTTMRAGNVIGGGDFAKDRIIPDCVRAAMKGEDIIVRNPYSIRPYQHVLEPVICYLLVAAQQYEHPEAEGCYNIGPDDKDAVTTAQIATMFCDCWNVCAGNASSEDARSESGNASSEDTRSESGNASSEDARSEAGNASSEDAGSESGNASSEDAGSESGYSVTDDSAAGDGAKSGQAADIRRIKWINKSDGGPHEANFLKLDCTKIKKTFGWAPVWNIERAMKELVRWYAAYAEDKDVGSITREQIGLYIHEMS